MPSENNLLMLQRERRYQNRVARSKFSIPSDETRCCREQICLIDETAGVHYLHQKKAEKANKTNGLSDPIL